MPDGGVSFLLKKGALTKRAYPGIFISRIRAVVRGPSRLYQRDAGFPASPTLPPRTFSCLKQDLQDLQDLQDEAAGTPRTGLEDLNVYSTATATRRKGPADLNVYSVPINTVGAVSNRAGQEARLQSAPTGEVEPRFHG